MDMTMLLGGPDSLLLGSKDCQPPFVHQSREPLRWTVLTVSSCVGNRGKEPFVHVPLTRQPLFTQNVCNFMKGAERFGFNIAAGQVFEGFTFMSKDSYPLKLPRSIKAAAARLAKEYGVYPSRARRSPGHAYE